MQRRGTLLALVAALALAACGSRPTAPTPPPVTDPGPTGTGTPPPAPPPAPTLNVTRILAFGDSMTSGTTSPPLPGLLRLDAGLPQSYPFKLQVLETDRYRDQTITVLNAGEAGRRATDDRQRLADAIKASNPQVLLLLEGANDLNTPNGGVTVTVNALEDMVRDTTAQGITVLLATLPPQRPPKGVASSTAARFNDALRVMAAKKGATIVDLASQFPIELIGQDGLHPTEDGYEKLAEIFQAAIASKWEQAPAGIHY